MTVKTVFSRLVKTAKRNGIPLLKWLALAVLVGIVVGAAGTAFHLVLEEAAMLYRAHPWLLYCLPLAGLAIVALYQFTDMGNDRGTELVLSSIRSGKKLRFRMAPLIFIATALTHLCGGSAGREGAALQLGGSISSFIGTRLHLDELDHRVITMCGMAAGFSALFGTPLAAAVFAMEVVSIGIMYYVAIVPCILSALIARNIAQYFGIASTCFSVANVPDNSPKAIAAVIVLGVLCGVLANFFCRAMHLGGTLYRKYLPNPWLRVVVGGILVIALSKLSGTGIYNGAGMTTIRCALGGDAPSFAFLWKILLTALTLNAGYKGGEIVPSFFVGATFGCVVAPFLGISSSFGAAVSMIAVFCGVTNAPMTSIILGYELFIGVTMEPMALVAAVSYMASGYHSLYHEQKIIYSKFKPKFIDVFSGDGESEG